MSTDKIVAAQIVEGTGDGALFEHFLFKLLTRLRRDQQTKSKVIVVYLDNARVHNHPRVVEMAARLRVTILFQAEYSPQLQASEQLHNALKRHLNELPRKPNK